jgi:hypothetical protein
MIPLRYVIRDSGRLFTGIGNRLTDHPTVATEPKFLPEYHVNLALQAITAIELILTAATAVSEKYCATLAEVPDGAEV